MSTFLFVAQPAMGHLNPMFAIARQLLSRGHGVFFVYAGPETVEKTIASKGFRVITVPMAPTTVGLAFLHLFSGYCETMVATRLFFAGLEKYSREVAAILDREKPDLVVNDFAFPGAGLAADLAGIPNAVVFSMGLCFEGPGVPPFASGLPIGEEWGSKGELYAFSSRLLNRNIERLVASTRSDLGLPEIRSARHHYFTSRWLTLFLTSEAMEVPRIGLPDSGYFIGPCFAGRDPGQAASFPWDRLSSDKPKVYVSLGTVFNKKPDVYGRIVDGFAHGRYQVIVSAGGAFPALSSRQWPDHVLLFERVPQVDLLARVDAMVSHGGNNTVNETLAAGKPLLVMPVGGEQGDNASRVVHLGAGLRADISGSGSEEIGQKVRRLIEEPAFARRAGEIAAALAKTDGPVVASRLLEHLARTREPLVRPGGYPLTITTGAPLPFER